MWSRTREVRYLMTFFISLLYYELKQKKVEVAQSYHNSVDICAVAPNLVCAIKVVFLRTVTNVIDIKAQIIQSLWVYKYNGQDALSGGKLAYVSPT